MEASIRYTAAFPAPAARRRDVLLVAALAAADAVEEALGLAAQVRWPDAVMVNRREVARVSAGDDRVEVRINVNDERGELATGAGSLLTIDGVRRDPDPIAAKLGERLELHQASWREGGLDAIYDTLGARDFLRGRRVAVDGASGTVVGIDRAGRLEIETTDGRVALETGEIDYEE